MNIYYFIVIAGVLVSALSQILLKKSAQKKHKHPIRQLLNPHVIIAYSIFLLVMMMNVFALSKGVNVKDIPVMESLSYIFIPTFSYLFFSEKISKKHQISILLIIVGIVIFYL